MYPGHPDFSPDDWFLGGMILFGVLLVAAVMFGDGLTTYYYGARQADGSRRALAGVFAGRKAVN